MLTCKKMMVVGLRWTVVVLTLLVLALSIRLGEGQIDQVTKYFCPGGWWHAGEFWAHCAYPPIAIFKLGAMYAGYAILALLMIHCAAPSLKLSASRLLLFALMAVPAYHLLMVQFSWVEACKLFLVAIVALIFGLRTRFAQKAQSARK